MGIGEKLKNLRISSKKTLKDESAIFNVSINTIYRWEHELTVPRKSSLIKIAAYYNVPPEWLFSDSDSSDSDVKKNTRCDFCILNPESPYNNMEQQLIKMFRNMRDNNKYKTLGYLERIYVEDMDDAGQKPFIKHLTTQNKAF
jgi:transcriptional regulator with XRE-family HTH domain